MAFAAIHYERGTFAAVVEPVRDAVLETMRDTPSLPHVVRGAPALSGSVTVVDGDTVRSGGEIYRLVGFNAPETGRNARCAGEDARGRAAAVRLRQLVDAGAVELRRLPCACATGTEGTNRCNFGRLCASLSADGRNVGAILISEGLAEPYHCSGTRCPPRRNWCG